MRVFSIFCENNYGSNIFMVVAAKNEAQAIKLFKREAKVPSIERESMSRAKEVLKEYKELVKRGIYRLTEYNFGFLTTCMLPIPDLSSKEQMAKLLETTKQNYINDYYKEGGVIQWNLDNNKFQVQNLTELATGLSTSKVLVRHDIYHGR